MPSTIESQTAGSTGIQHLAAVYYARQLEIPDWAAEAIAMEAARRGFPTIIDFKLLRSANDYGVIP
jgi:hypothetical protein